MNMIKLTSYSRKGEFEIWTINFMDTWRGTNQLSYNIIVSQKKVTILLAKCYSISDQSIALILW